jgi:copper chaperone
LWHNNFKNKDMTHKYSVKGMSCSGCVANVRKALEAVPGVTQVEVQQQPGQATVTMESHIDTRILQQAVQQYGKYELSEIH